MINYPYFRRFHETDPTPTGSVRGRGRNASAAVRSLVAWDRKEGDRRADGSTHRSWWGSGNGRLLAACRDKEGVFAGGGEGRSGSDWARATTGRARSVALRRRWKGRGDDARSRHRRRLLWSTKCDRSRGVDGETDMHWEETVATKRLLGVPVRLIRTVAADVVADGARRRGWRPREIAREGRRW